MTDKQIIIDGIDVAKCRCFTSEWDFNNCGHICKGTECKYKRLWYKKQLKRKEQECEELKKIINEAKSSSLDLQSFLVGEAVQNEYEQQLDQLKAENESLKDSLKMFSSTLDWALKSQVGLYKRQIDSSVPDDWEYEEVLVLVEQYIEKIKQTLAEIKEIAEGMHDLWINKTPYTDMDNLVKHILECELNRIRYKLDEISELEK